MENILELIDKSNVIKLTRNKNEICINKDINKFINKKWNKYEDELNINIWSY